jgi:iron complex outermembrane receptor protein
VINLRESFTLQNLRFDLGVENLANQQYYNPLGGINIANFEAGENTLLHTPVSAMGRMIYGGVTVKF